MLSKFWEVMIKTMCIGDKPESEFCLYEFEYNHQENMVDRKQDADDEMCSGESFVQYMIWSRSGGVKVDKLGSPIILQ